MLKLGIIVVIFVLSMSFVREVFGQQALYFFAVGCVFGPLLGILRELMD
jgi:hypothetical protein